MKKVKRGYDSLEMIEEFQNRIDELRGEPVESCDTVQASEDYEEMLDEEYNRLIDAGYEEDLDYDDEFESDWEFIERKQVQDYDGFWTDYTLYHNIATDEWATVFGDRDLYGPEEGYFDAEFDSEWEAREWFDNYETDYEDRI